MEAFQLLSRGGAKFNKSRFRDDIQIFNTARTSGPTVAQGLGRDVLPADIDFFKYAEGSQAKRKQANREDGGKKKKRRIETHSDSEAEDQDASQPAPPRQPHRVTAKGSNVPEAVDSFDVLSERFQLPSHVSDNLKEFGYRHPTAIQSHAIPILLENRDLAAISPTGTGKTLSYLLPIFMALRAPHPKDSKTPGVRALILAPTRELAQQIHNECLKLAQGRKWKILLLSKATANTLSDQSARDKVDIIVSTPLRLVSMLQTSTIKLESVKHLVLDEADRLLDREFLSQVEEIVASCKHPHLQTAVFSATLPSGAEKTAMEMLNDPIRLVVGLKDTPLPLISQSLTYVSDDSSKLPTLLSYLHQPYNPPVLIFTSTQPRATSLCEELVLNGIPNVDSLHAGMSKKEREDSIHRMRQGQSWILISTEVMARGMDFKGIREVINFDFPTSVQSYIHRIGRTGRAGQEGKAVTYFTKDDAPYLKPIANVLLQSGSQVPEWILKLPKPSKLKRRQMGKVARPEVINKARKIGKNETKRKIEMVEGSKRRAAKQALKEDSKLEEDLS